MKNGLKKILEWVLNIFILIAVLIILFGIYYVVQIKLLKNPYADILGYTFFEVATGSMADTIQIGDVVIVKLLDNTDKLIENDIVVFSEEDYFITHRIVEIEEDKLITKGDANNSSDKPIQRQAVIGKVIYTIPSLGILKKIIFSPQIIITSIITIFIVGIAFVYSGKENNLNKNGEKDGR